MESHGPHSRVRVSNGTAVVQDAARSVKAGKITSADLKFFLKIGWPYNEGSQLKDVRFETQ